MNLQSMFLMLCPIKYSVDDVEFDVIDVVWCSKLLVAGVFHFVHYWVFMWEYSLYQTLMECECLESDI